MKLRRYFSRILRYFWQKKWKKIFLYLKKYCHAISEKVTRRENLPCSTFFSIFTFSRIVGNHLVFNSFVLNDILPSSYLLWVSTIVPCQVDFKNVHASYELSILSRSVVQGLERLEPVIWILTSRPCSDDSL